MSSASNDFCHVCNEYSSGNYKSLTEYDDYYNIDNTNTKCSKCGKPLSLEVDLPIAACSHKYHRNCSRVDSQGEDERNNSFSVNQKRNLRSSGGVTISNTNVTTEQPYSACSDAPYTQGNDPKNSSLYPRLDQPATPLPTVGRTSVISSETLEHDVVVYISNLPVENENSAQLKKRIQQRLFDIFRIEPMDIQCHSNIGVGMLRVKSKDREHLVNVVGKIALDLGDDSVMISFKDTIQFESYIVLERKSDDNYSTLPKPEELLSRWTHFYNGEQPLSCEQLNIQYPNIYRIRTQSVRELLNIVAKPTFVFKNRPGQIYPCAYCSYFEDLPATITEDELLKLICNTIGSDKILPSSSLYIQMDSSTNTACILATDTARKWANKDAIYIGSEFVAKRKHLSYYLLFRPIRQKDDVDKLIRHKAFEGKAKMIHYFRRNVILKIYDQNIYEKCLKSKTLKLSKGGNEIKIEPYIGTPDPNIKEIDSETWYDGEMLQCEPNIMPFIQQLNHQIFRLQWNEEIWREQFEHIRTLEDQNQNHTWANDMRHRLRVTVMLNTLAVIKEKSYTINDEQVQLNLNTNLRTIVYNHKSKLQLGGSIPIKATPYKRTEVKVVNDDCLVIYEDLVKKGKKPLLLNMASATSPGGGYRKGDGAQEENLFRRSDYFRSLDIDLDTFEQPSVRLFRTSKATLNSPNDPKSMYPMDEYGAIYTSGITVFRGTENDGYPYMKEPLTDVCSIAMAAYRHPALDDNLLSPKFAIGMRKKIENVFAIGHHHSHDCLVLSALGCGAFRNPPEHVAKIFRSVIEQYAGFFQVIIFAIIDNPNSKSDNFQIFSDELHGKTITPFSSMNQPNTMIGPYHLSTDGTTVHDISICHIPPCKFAAKCTEIYDSNHASKFSHPSTCIEQVLNNKCTKIDDSVHMSSFIHRQPCKYGVQCPSIDDRKHADIYEHPDFCPTKGSCADTSDSHEKQYRHLPLCRYAHKCEEFRTHVKSHCEEFRHYMPSCQDGSYCIQFHSKEHLSNYKHPFPTPCRWTPYKCPFQDELSQSSSTEQASQNAREHCLEYAHVCPYGRNCKDTNTWHWEKWIHIARMFCKFGSLCDRITQEDHLNSFTHPNIHDIRVPCKDADKCTDRRKPEHLSICRHSMTVGNSGIVRYFNLNKNINFIQNQDNNMKRILDYAKTVNWDKFSLESIPKEIINWVRTLQPVHRCKIEIFESIILHGHVMSLEYMDNLSKPHFVANSVLQHSEVRQINRLKIPDCADHARKYITALIIDIYEKAGFRKFYDGTNATATDDATRAAQRTESITREEHILSAQINNSEHMKTIRAKTEEIAQASMKLNLDKSGIGYEVDKKLGTNKTIFSVLGPHSGHYYGDIVLLLKRDILHHPDTNYTIQAGTSYHSGRCFQWRPWFGANPNVEATQIDLFHKTKLNPSIPGYEYATALELIAVTCHHQNIKPADVTLDKVISRWLSVDSHQTIEAHLPPLIPLDYIEHIYIPKTIYDALSANTRRVVDSHFKDCMTILDKVSTAYNADVVNQLDQRFRQNDLHTIARPIQGAVITIPSTNFTDHYILPLTISQANEQYRKDHPTVPKDSSIFIYWQLMNGDMMLTLSSKPIETNQTDSCLICYVAPKPTHHTPTDIQYHEETSYLNSGLPFEHSIFVNDRIFAGQTNEFYVGCNTDDIMTLCLEIQPSTQTVILSHAGPNSIYNHQKISCKFPSTQLDLHTLDFIHVSAGNQTVPIRNLFVTFEKQEYLHPSIDSKLKKISTSDNKTSSSLSETNTDDSDSEETSDDESFVINKKEPTKSSSLFGRLFEKTISVAKTLVTIDNTPLKPCPKSINCLIQYSDNASTHNSQFSHPCRFAEFCRNLEFNLTHPKESFTHPQCSLDKKCEQLCDPVHRAQYSHSDLPFYCIPCRFQKACTNKSDDHRKKYSHGEEGLQTIADELSKTQVIRPTKQGPVKAQVHHPVKVVPCKWGSDCRIFKSAEHRAHFSHPPGTETKDNRVPCRYGDKCYDHSPSHHAKFSHPST